MSKKFANGCIPCRKEEIHINKESKEEVVENIPTVKGEDINTIKCGKSILSITQVGDKALVTYDDCTYSTVEMSKVSIGSNNKKTEVAITCLAQEMLAIQAKLKELEEVANSKYDDTALKARINVLENKPDKDTIYNDNELRELIKGVSEAVNKRIDSISNSLNGYVAKKDLVTVKNLEGESKFKVYPLEVDNGK